MNFLKNRSLSFKLLLLFLLTAIAIIVALRFASGNTFVKHIENSIRPHLYQYFSYINQEIGSPPNIATAQKLSDSLNLKIIIQGPDIHWSSDNNFPKLHRLHFIKHSGDKGDYESGRIHKGFAVRFSDANYKTTFLTQANSGPPPMGKLLFVLLVVLSLLYLLLRWMISPIKDIQQSVKRIGSGELKHRIVINRQDELGKLSSEINAMADDVENMLEAKRQLLLAISHELRSPITRARVALSLMNDQHLKEGLEGDLGEMEVMISGLLEAEKLNDRHQVLNLEKVQIDELIQEVITSYYSDENITQNLKTNQQELQIDDARIRFTIKNLLSNALKHRKKNDDAIIISTEINDTECIITVKDNGKGISEKHLPHLTEPFYRADPSRNRNTGGYGLGLYIIDRVVTAHHGKLSIKSTENIGTEVMIRLPLSSLANSDKR